MEKKYLSAKEAATYLGFTISYLYRLTSLRKVPFIKRPGGRRIMFAISDLDRWMSAGRVPNIDELESRVATISVMGRKKQGNI